MFEVDWARSVKKYYPAENQSRLAFIFTGCGA
jgi:hypothetical protein